MGAHRQGFGSDGRLNSRTPEEFLALVRRETPKWAGVIKALRAQRWIE